MPRIHPTAIVDAGARLADDVVIGPYCVFEPDVEIGAGTELRSHVVVRRSTTMGEGNVVDPFAVFGGLPQDVGFDPQIESRVRIGDGNVFREGATISRASRPGAETVVGNNTYWMTSAHAGHDATVEDHAVLANNAGVAGHSTLHRRAILSGNAMVHQFTWVGELVMTQGLTGISSHAPPYTMIARINTVVGLNAVGLRRAPDIDDEDRRQIKEAFGLTYRSGLTPTAALAKMDTWDDITPAAAKFREFLRKVLNAEGRYRRGLCSPRHCRERR